MNPLEELKERLVSVIVAGTQLLDEDFRLKKIAEKFAVLAQKNAVFQKIHTDLQQLLTAEPNKRGILVLNLLGLVDAVLYTQADCGTEGEPLQCLQSGETVAAKAEFLQISYKVLQPLLQLFQKTGSGRLDTFHTVITQTPELLADIRVLGAMVQDINDPYQEMGSYILKVLEAMGNETPVLLLEQSGYMGRLRHYPLPKADKNVLIALLKKDFDPQGNREMAYRAELIGKIAGERQSEWYLQMLPQAKKEVRQRLIENLGYSKSNLPLLFELFKKERKNGKQAVLVALAKTETPQTLAFWEKQLQEDFESVKYLHNNDSDPVADVVVTVLYPKIKALFEEFDANKDKNSPDLDLWMIQCTAHKTADSVFAFYRWLLEDANENCFNGNHLYRLEDAIIETLMAEYPQKMLDFLNSLSPKQAGKIDRAYFVADFLTLPAKQVFDKWSKKFFPSKFDKLMGLVTGNYKPEDLVWWLEKMRFVDGKHSFYSVSQQLQIYRQTKEPMDSRWFDLILKNGIENLLWLVPTDKESIEAMGKDAAEEMYAKIGNYYYQKTMGKWLGKNKRWYYHAVYDMRKMKEYHWKQYRGIVLAQCQMEPHILLFQFRELWDCYRECAEDEQTLLFEAQTVWEFYQKRPAARNAKQIMEFLQNEGFVTPKTP